MDKASKAADRLWGADRIKEMRKANGYLKEEIDLLEQKGDEIDSYLKQDKNDLKSAAKDMGYGVQFSFDEAGNIINYEEELTKLYNIREQMLDSFGKDLDESE
jgi:hypothetical protein